MISVEIITKDENLDQLVRQINGAQWDEDNDMVGYDAAALSHYLAHQGTVFLACYEMLDEKKRLLGIASGRFEIKPYGRERWLYIDEVDVCANQRRKGAGKAMMERLLRLAKEAGCEEVWLGTEPDNHAANALYRSLKPVEVENFVGYTYRLRK